MKTTRIHFLDKVISVFTSGHVRRNIVTIAAVLAMTAAFSVAGSAQCISLDQALTAAASLRDKTTDLKTPGGLGPLEASDSAAIPSIVGLWHIRFFVGDNVFQEAFQIWDLGGTEVHNPKVDPRGGTVCLGTWRQAPQRIFMLTHRVWLYDTNGNFQGTGHLAESVVLNDKGDTQSGTFTLEVYDPDGNLVATIPGTVVGERIPAQ